MTKLWYFTFDFLHLIAEISLDIAKKPFALGFSLAKRRLSFSMRRPNSRHSCGFRARPKMKTLIFLNETKNWDYNHRFRTIIGSTLLYLFIYIYLFHSNPLFLWPSTSSTSVKFAQFSTSIIQQVGGWQVGPFRIRHVLCPLVVSERPWEWSFSHLFGREIAPRFSTTVRWTERNILKNSAGFCGSFHESWRRERCNSNLPWVENQLEMLDLLNLWGISYIPTSTATFCRSILLPLSASSGLQRKPPSWHSSKNPCQTNQN